MTDIQKNGPIVSIYFSVPEEIEKKLIAENKSVPEPVSCDALIDTGASNCVIQEEIPLKLGLKPVNEVNISTPSHPAYRCYSYYLKITILPQNLVYQGVFTAVPHLKGQNIHCLIGRDLLANGIFIYIGYANQFSLSF